MAPDRTGSLRTCVYFVPDGNAIAGALRHWAALPATASLLGPAPLSPAFPCNFEAQRSQNSNPCFFSPLSGLHWTADVKHRPYSVQLLCISPHWPLSFFCVDDSPQLSSNHPIRSSSGHLLRAWWVNVVLCTVGAATIQITNDPGSRAHDPPPMRGMASPGAAPLTPSRDHAPPPPFQEERGPWVSPAAPFSFPLLSFFPRSPWFVCFGKLINVVRSGCRLL